MFVKLIMVVVCAAATAFYLRFLIALRKEPDRLRACHWIRLRLTFKTETSPPRARINTLTRAAEKLDEFNISRGGFK
jgi:hypothetical protein